MAEQTARRQKATQQTIFIIDDHPVFREGLIHLLEREADLKVCGEADNALEALDAILKLQPTLALVDITLPGKNGLELIKDLRSACRDTALLVISMHDEALYAERVLRAGARGYIMKQEGPAKILHGIRQVLKGQIYLSDKMSGRILSALCSPAAPKIRSPLERLTDREFEILQLVGEGKASHDIARQLHLSPKTVDAHRAHIREKLELETGTQLIRYAVRWVETQRLEDGRRPAGS